MSHDRKQRKLAFALGGAALLALAACGGGGGSTTTAAPAGPVTPAPGAISGVAATGAALANANVAITDSSGTSPCEQAAITTTGLGSYSCTLKAGKTAPFFVVVTDPTGNTPAMVSVQTTTPTAGQALTVNVTPLTTAIVAQLSADGNALSVVSSKTVDAAALKQVTTNVVAQLAKVLTALGVPAGYDPFSTSITAATATGVGNTADLVLEVVRITTDVATGKPALSTISDPTPVVLATATTTGQQVAQPSANVADLSKATQLLSQTLNNCFAVPLAQRVLSVDSTISQANGGPEVESVAPACQNLAFFQEVNDPARPNFLHNGYSDGQYFYNILTGNAMTGAQFSVPEIVAFYPADSNSVNDSAVVNIKYLDNAGNPGNLVTVARRYAGTATTARPTDWWLAGNQRSADVSVRLNIRRVEQLNPNAGISFQRSTFQTGLQFRINYQGPGSVRSGEPLNYARVSGLGLPGNGAANTGLVYGRSNPANTNTMDIYRKDGVIPTTVAYGCGGTEIAQTFDCPNFWLARTAGITGTASTTITANPANNLVWAQPGESTPTAFVKGARYKIELFYGSNTTTPGLVVHTTLTSDLVQATQAVNLPWNPPGTATAAALDPNGAFAGAQTNLLIDWAQNPAAQQISGVSPVVDRNGSYGFSKAVPKGATSVRIDNNTVPAFAEQSGQTPTRTILLSYRMLDTSNKTAVYRYN
ncbi:MAG: hypothetical protein EOO28_05295 [Comamonadaceae bacterium]|nr:MAG: hypothetical protein EOO28_05295 [Comamonadaceae bacterium]